MWTKMATSFGTEDFAIDSNKKTLVEKHLKKIERLFSVKVGFDDVSEEGEESKQWLMVSGSKDNGDGAKKYVQAMCNPEQVMDVKCSGRPSLDDAVLEEVECATAAFLERTGALSLEVKGSELSCMLAISQLEQTYRLTVVARNGKEQEGVFTNSNQPMRDEVRSMLNTSPAEVLRGVKGLVVDGCADDPMDIDDTDDCQLFTSSKSNKDKVSPDINSFPQACSSRQEGQATASAFNSCIVGVSPARKAGQDFEQGCEDNEGSRTSSPEGAVADAEQQKSELKSIGSGMGFTDSEIEDTLGFFDFSTQSVQPHEFLCALDAIHANRPKDKSDRDTLPSKQDPNSGWKVVGNKGKTSQPATNSKTAAKEEKKVGKGKKQGKAKQSPPKPTATSTPVATKPKTAVATTMHVAQTPPAGKELDDSVIIVGEESASDSVCIVDAFPMEPEPARFGPPIVPPSSTSQSRTGCKRKEYSDDEEQTIVLKPYSADTTSSNCPARHDDTAPFMQAVGLDGFEHTQKDPRNSAGKVKDDLRFIVIDGSNVAMSHGNDKIYSCKGIKICVEYFVSRGHRVKAWVPQTKTYRKQPEWAPPITHQEILDELKDQGYLGFTPARCFNKRRIVSHDDPFILELAKMEDAVIISNDNFREFVKEYQFIIENRVLSYVFSDDHFMLPQDPLGRHGPTLKEFLRKSGHPCNQPTSTSSASRPARVNAAAVLPNTASSRDGGGKQTQSQSSHPRNPQSDFPRLPLRPNPHASGARFAAGNGVVHKQFSQAVGGFPPAAVVRPTVISGDSGIPKHKDSDKKTNVTHQEAPPPKAHPRRPKGSANPRHPEITKLLLEELQKVFPEKSQAAKLQQVLENHPNETDLNTLTNYCINAFS